MGKDSNLFFTTMYYIYIIMNPGRTTMYTGVTNNLRRRISEHIESMGSSHHFASKYNCQHLVYYECFRYINNAIRREKQIKRLRRSKKLDLIKSTNPTLRQIDYPT